VSAFKNANSLSRTLSLANQPAGEFHQSTPAGAPPPNRIRERTGRKLQPEDSDIEEYIRKVEGSRRGKENAAVSSASIRMLAGRDRRKDPVTHEAIGPRGKVSTIIAQDLKAVP